MKNEWLIYGANGYSAQLAAEKAVKLGMKPILAGRSVHAIEAVADKLDLDYRVFDLSNQDSLVRQLEDVKVLSHCAGPFFKTAKPMIDACIKAGTHYTDITGEVSVFNYAQSQDVAARQANVAVCSGVGFDVIPTDCLANRLKQALPDATHLTLGFDGDASVSPGTAKTMVEVLGDGIQVRRDGKLVNVGRNFEMRKIDYGQGKALSAVIPWGDISTAYWQTKIPNITVYAPLRGSKAEVYLFPLVQRLMRVKAIQSYAKMHIKTKVRGPSEKTRSRRETYLWGEAMNAAGKKVTARIKTPNGYTVTMDGILATAKYLMEYEGEGGCLTPSQLMGPELVENLPGTTRFKLAS